MSESINVTIKLFAQYRDDRFKIEQRVYKSGTTAQDVMDELGISEHKLPLGVLMVNSKHEKEDYVLQEGDILALFPKVGGG
ncbi:MoaD/ThiS family protein [Sulfurospirillum arcachonense]|uniref:MoaD/ThiS family protein n=1 Tax=Sulfurospirillum arcachonense TaxID=57666 RepID=UPI0004B860C9|nr:MoaD/ThiS family protein [Sulfurospirillum arcachonense]